MRVLSSFNIDEVTCADFNTDIYQLGVLLHPPEVINEKFLIRLRDCVVKLPQAHALKRWMSWIGSLQSQGTTQEERIGSPFLTEIINSQFNLITDIQVKNRIIEALSEVPDDTLPELLLRSYLYLMIGNVSRSDGILRDFIKTAPRLNWERSAFRASRYHRIARDQAQQILSKLARHPADRSIFQLLVLYLRSYYNDPGLLRLLDGIDTNEVEAKLDLRFTLAVAPELVHFRRLSLLPEMFRVRELRGPRIPLPEQSYWVWPFIDVAPLISEALLPELKRLEAQDQLWLIYLLDDERLADLYSRTSGKSFLPGRRKFLKEGLETEASFMLCLYKLIELGDIDEALVRKTAEVILR